MSQPKLEIAKDPAPAAATESANEKLEQTPAEEPKKKATPEEAFAHGFIPMFFMEYERTNFVTMAKDAISFASPNSDNLGRKMRDVLEHFDSALTLYCTNCNILSHLAEAEAAGDIKCVQDIIDRCEEMEWIYNEANGKAAIEALGDNATMTKKPTVPYATYAEDAIKFVLENMINKGALTEDQKKYERKIRVVGEYNSIYDEDAKACIPLTYRATGDKDPAKRELYMAGSFMRMPVIVHSFGAMRDLLKRAETDKVEWGTYLHFLTVFNAAMYSMIVGYPNADKGGFAVVPKYLGEMLASTLVGMIQCFTMDDKAKAITLVTMIVDEVMTMTEEWVSKNADASRTLESKLDKNWPVLMKMETYKTLAINALVSVDQSAMSF